MSGFIGGSQPVAFVTDSIDATSIATDGVDSDEIKANAVGTSEIADDAVTAAKLANSINTDIAAGAAALPLAGGTMSGNIVMVGTDTVDGVDISVRDAILTSTTTTAGAALPKAGGAMTGNITMSGSQTVDGRDVSADGTKLDNVASNANNYVHPNHSGDVVSAADGGMTIQADAVDIAMLSAGGSAGNTTFLRGDNTWAVATGTYVHPNHSGDVVSSSDGAMTIQADAVDIAMLSATGTAGNTTYLRGDNAWATVDALPSQSGHSGKFLTTDATNASWATLDTDANTTTKGLYEMANTIAANYSITSGNNAMTAGPITINSNVSVTVPSGSTWVIA